MAELLKSGALLLMNEECFDNYFIDYNFFNGECFKALLSKGLGLAIIAGSLLVKVPQVLKIMHNKSGEGINIISVFLDLMAITFHMSYSFMNGFPFSAWGDNTFLALQTAAIAALIIFFGGAKAKSFIFCVTYSVLLYVLNSGMTPMKVLMTMQSFTIPILLAGKLYQAWTNYQNGSTGQLSAVTVCLLFAGSLARIFTSIQETGDQMMIITFCASSFANGIILAQLLYYWNKPAKTGKSDGPQKSTSTKKSRAKQKKAD